MKPALFATPMVQPIDNYTKYKTRRLIKEAFGKDDYDVVPAGDWIKPISDEHYILAKGNFELLAPFTSKYKTGDTLWVRETWQQFDDGEFVHRADGFRKIKDGWVRDVKNRFHDQELVKKWKPSIFMPKEAARIFLKVTDVKPERLGDISEDDAIAEGVLQYDDGTFKNYFKKKGLRATDQVECLTAVSSFQSLWHSINGEWNPRRWVWVYTFERTEKPIF